MELMIRKMLNFGGGEYLGYNNAEDKDYYKKKVIINGIDFEKFMNTLNILGIESFTLDSNLFDISVNTKNQIILDLKYGQKFLWSISRSTGLC